MPSSPNAVPYSAMSMVSQDRAAVATAVAQRFLFGSTPGSFRSQLENHPRGGRFKGAVIRKVEPYTLANAATIFAAMSGGVASNPQTIVVGQEVLPLKKPSVTLSLRSNIVAETGKSPYINLIGVLISYRSMVSVFSDPSGVEIFLKDKGMPATETMPRVEVNKTLNSNILLGLNYPVHRESLGDLSFTIQTSNTGVAPHRAWCTVEIRLVVSASSKPYQRGMTRSAVQYVLPSDLFEVTNNDPRLFNAILSPEDLELLREMAENVEGGAAIAHPRGFLASVRNRDLAAFGDPTIHPGDSTSDDGADSDRTGPAIQRGNPLSVRFAGDVPHSGPNTTRVSPPSLVGQELPLPMGSLEQEAAAELMRSLGWDVVRGGDGQLRDRDSGQPVISTPRPLGAKHRVFTSARKIFGLQGSAREALGAISHPSSLPGLEGEASGLVTPARCDLPLFGSVAPRQQSPPLVVASRRPRLYGLPSLYRGLAPPQAWPGEPYLSELGHAEFTRLADLHEASDIFWVLKQKHSDIALLSDDPFDRAVPISFHSVLEDLEDFKLVDDSHPVFEKV